MNLFDLTGKIAIVTGASSGLGVQFAKALARQGADVAIVARRLEKLESLSKEITSMGRKCLAVKCDVTNEQDIINAVKKIVNEYGTIDILVNNAGISVVEKVEEHSLELWNKVIQTNLTGVFLFAREVGKTMIKNKYGKVINTASINGHVGSLGGTNTAYCASKGAVVNFTRALSAEWAPYNITVNAIGPGCFESEMTAELIGNEFFEQLVKSRCPMGRMGRQGELDGALIYLASDASSYTTGQTIFVDGGWTSV
ncbi:gluconate 5-dehydrogenase [Gottschalkia purinilytica]|uniref:Gluconate 5-dehydrogenase n=1 Tax=Gottschalkia purinilytica TaxID=1503 RepID=A0A0L0W7Q2_GOTPU|nr:glucose 1-dehydrogenase [Gottschalkia purinilytica]KNF07335.1 gluconate 5-dehydrogenase [Gottschalkia purinilytica]